MIRGNPAAVTQHLGALKEFLARNRVIICLLIFTLSLSGTLIGLYPLGFVLIYPAIYPAVFLFTLLIFLLFFMRCLPSLLVLVSGGRKPAARRVSAAASLSVAVVVGLLFFSFSFYAGAPCANEVFYTDTGRKAVVVLEKCERCVPEQVKIIAGGECIAPGKEYYAYPLKMDLFYQRRDNGVVRMYCSDADGCAVASEYGEISVRWVSEFKAFAVFEPSNAADGDISVCYVDSDGRAGDYGTLEVEFD